ncbi:glutaredoxin 3 [Legionella israelensis]|uniref:Glutaredoxin n=1 Tax=Legionella israelensis TaxID=454 RepID=A0A0W0V4P7_9GAMM|nr:glutaredoxin 3 [Legionella israelensis]KTD15061.1 glutaredoxin Grx [Legionella israelensis]QBR84923.1 glutaredoxin 3 [Legionella israelensis]QBS10189.1 glutaredoxin 3 [Legionella israelensis]QDP73404.1 glutaredoxin 3 [Legionella israelensis]SCY19948.1 glutaredoxin 3 [Legionella israelensis DSM 19235]
MAKVLMYSTAHCPFCVRARELLRRKKIDFHEIRVDEKPELRDEMIAKSGRRTVPQIFINDKPIGGFDDLYTLDQQGQLDQLIRG